MTIGEALAQARLQAGLSVAQVSQKTRIREAIIRDIERDDYSACGGDFYARGHIRAMARAAGIDAEGLIRQYDAAGSGSVPFAGDQLAAAEEPPAWEAFGPDGFAAPEDLAAPDDFRPAGYGPGARDELGPDGPGGFAAPEEFAPGGVAAPGEFAPGGIAASGEFAPGGIAAPGEFAPGGFAGSAEGGFAPSGGFVAAEEFAGPQEDGFASSGEFAPGGFAGSAEGGFAPSGGFVAAEEFAGPQEDGFASSGEFAPGGFAGSAAPEEFAAPEETTAPNRVVTASQMAAFDDIMASGPAAAPEGTAPQRSRPARPAQARPAPARTAPARPAPARRPDRPDRVRVAAVVLALAIFGGLAYLLVAGTRATPRAGAAAATGRAAQHQAASGRRQGAAHSPAANTGSASPAPATPSAPPAALTPARAVAFGPGGPAHGDNPQNASLAIDHRPRTAWQTDWYATSRFGSLKAGTGLLLDMGHRVTLSSARIRLGAMPGADFQLRAGDTATLAGLRPMAGATNARGTIRLELTRPARVRYVLIWFTQLPLDAAGTYQVSVYHIGLR